MKGDLRGFALAAVLLSFAALMPLLTLLLVRSLLHERLAIAAERAAVATAAADHLLDLWGAAGAPELPDLTAIGAACSVRRFDVVRGEQLATGAATVAFEGVEVVRRRAFPGP